MNIKNELEKDEYGGIYSADNKRLLKCPNVKRYRIAEGCEEVDEKAFVGCSLLESLYVPYTFSEDTFDALMASGTANNEIGNICHWNRPYVEEVYDVNEFWYDEDETMIDACGVMYANEGKRLIMSQKPDLIGKEYFVPDGVLTICNGAFGFCSDYLVLSLPRIIKNIGDYIFGQEGGRMEIRDR